MTIIFYSSNHMSVQSILLFSVHLQQNLQILKSFTHRKDCSCFKINDNFSCFSLLEALPKVNDTNHIAMIIHASNLKVLFTLLVIRSITKN